MPSNLFGQGDYYPQNHSIVQLIEDYEKTYKDLFEKIKTDWNNTIREYLRSATGLRLSQNKKIKIKQKDVAISVDILPDCQDEFVRLVDKYYPDLDFNEYASLRDFQDSLKKTSKYLDGDSKPTHETEELLKYCEQYFAKYDLSKIIEILFNERSRSTDVCGTYTYQNHSVELFYLPIIVFAKLKSLDQEYVLVTVLVHELSHAYHHSGYDQDNIMWSNMPGTDKEILEGLAQYYTDRFVKENEIMYPQLKKAYETMLSCQKGPYLVHKQWLNSFSEEHIKLAMYTARRTSVKKYPEFLKVLANSKNTLK